MAKVIKFILRWIYTNSAKRTVKNYGDNLTVNLHSKFNSSTTLANNCNFNGLVVSGKGPLSIGDNFHSGKNCQVITQVHNYKGTKIPYDETYLLKTVIIGDNVWLGHNVIIIGECEIGEGAIIQAGSVVVNDIPKLGIAGGNPAKVFKFRDENHYVDLCNKGMFH